MMNSVELGGLHEVCVQPGYVGDNTFFVDFRGRIVKVIAKDKYAALATAAEKFGMRWQDAKYHQNAKVWRG